MDEVEAVARAICDASPVFKNGWDEQTPVEKAIWLGVAHAAIAALDACGAVRRVRVDHVTVAARRRLLPTLLSGKRIVCQLAATP